MLYRFSDNTFDNRGFTWAMSIHPMSQVIHHACSTCKTVEDRPSGAFDVTVEGGTKYPDVLGCGAFPFLIVSQAVISAWYEAAITSFHTYPVGVAEVKSRRLRDTIPPKYFRVEINGRCKIDSVASNIPVVRICPECGRVIEKPVYPFAHTHQMVPGSWDGSPLFRDAEFYPTLHFCTELVFHLASRHRFTNFRFEPMDAVPTPEGKGIEYLTARGEVPTS